MIEQPSFLIRRGDLRGRTDLGWLHSQHSFSFGHYQDPDQMGFRSLRVLNDDVVEPGGGFGEHGHDNMEIITWVLEGELAHEDSTGTRGVIRPGDAQVMTAGRGIRHSEMNASKTDSVHFLQIWIIPASRDLEPAYSQTSFAKEERCNQWQLITSPDGRKGSILIQQDALLSIADLEEGRHLDLIIDSNRHGYLHLALGSLQVGDTSMQAGDAIKTSGDIQLTLEALDDSQLLFFDLS